MRYLKVILTISLIFFMFPVQLSASDYVQSEPVQNSQQIIDLGEFKLTAYCPCVKCCGKNDGVTSTGVTAQPNRTIAVDTDVIPYGSIIIIDGKEYVAEDCGGSIKGNRIDIYFDTHKEALEFGIQHKNVSMIEFE